MPIWRKPPRRYIRRDRHNRQRPSLSQTTKLISLKSSRQPQPHQVADAIIRLVRLWRHYPHTPLSGQLGLGCRSQAAVRLFDHVPPNTACINRLDSVEVRSRGSIGSQQHAAPSRRIWAAPISSRDCRHRRSSGRRRLTGRVRRVQLQHHHTAEPGQPRPAAHQGAAQAGGAHGPPRPARTGSPQGTRTALPSREPQPGGPHGGPAPRRCSGRPEPVEGRICGAAVRTSTSSARTERRLLEDRRTGRRSRRAAAEAVSTSRLTLYTRSVAARHACIRCRRAVASSAMRRAISS